MSNPVNTNQQLADYIKKNISKGYTMDSLKYSLMKQGYSRTSIEKGMELANKQLAEIAPKMEEKPIVRFESVDEEELRKRMEAQDRADKGLFGRIKSWFS
jgi:SOS response regulatory protein OraA/RecX